MCGSWIKFYGGVGVTVNPHIIEKIDLTGKVAIVTGAASGIGLVSARYLCEAGASTALLDIDSKRGPEVEASLRDQEHEVLYVPCDVSQDADCRAAVQKVVETFGRIDILFNNAGIIIRHDSLKLSEKDWDLSLDVGLKGMFLMSRHVIPHMIEGGGGSIINSGSGWALRGGPEAISYCAAKGGVLNLTRAMAIDHGPHNIRANCVCPGDIDTPLLRGEAAQMGRTWKDFLEEAADRPLKRVGSPEDVAKAVLFFASELSSWVTGAFLVVDGGGLA